MSAVLDAEALHFAYDKHSTVLEGIDVSLRAGRLTALVGPNGAGKSTLLRLLCGLLRPTQGRVLLNHLPLDKIAPRQRARMLAFLPQEVQPAFSLTAFEVVCLGRYPHTGGLGSLGAQDLAVARRSLAETETEHLATRDFGTLSGGERRRVLLAGALAQEPALLLLDEPTAGLDLHHESGVFVLLRRLADQGVGIGVVTHDLNRAARYCDTLLLLGADHRLHAHGAPTEVMDAALLSGAYGAALRVARHPFTGAPFVDAEEPAP
jgi:iron complex transport system ATP-binding protein